MAVSRQCSLERQMTLSDLGMLADRQPTSMAKRRTLSMGAITTFYEHKRYLLAQIQ